MKDKTSRIFEAIACVVLGSYCGIMLIYAKLHPVKTKVDGMKSYTFPVAIYVIMLVCCLIVLVQNIIVSKKYKKELEQIKNENFTGEQDSSGLKEYYYQKTDKRIMLSIVFIILYAASWKILGFAISTFLFVGCESKMLKKETPIWKCILISAISVIVIYLIFKGIFSIRLPETFLRKYL